MMQHAITIGDVIWLAVGFGGLFVIIAILAAYADGFRH
jgi:hypothetical protein